MPDHVLIRNRRIGAGEPCLIVAEIGQNHDGDLRKAIQLIDAAHEAGVDVVKFQKRTLEICIPPEQRDVPRDTPWGRLSYLDYRRKLEFGPDQYWAIHRMCQAKGLWWTASVWDEPSLDFLLQFDPPFIKIPSACLTDISLLEACRRSSRPVVASTGMSSDIQIQRAIVALGPDRLVLLHCTSTYPVQDVAELNLRCIPILRERFAVPVGFSDHSTGVWASLAAAVLGACVVEKHFTYSRAARGTDHAASVEPDGMARIVRYIRRWEAAQGDGVKRIYDSERPVMARLRRVL